MLVAVLLSPELGRAQITLDGSLGPAGPLTGPSYVIGSEVGQIRSNNLFHSFGQFNVHTGESATFTGPGSIANIVSRVTGGLASSIDGLIDSRTWMPSANFFLLNPSGVLFGPNAAFSVGGAFHASTADYLRFADGAKFFANLSKESTLTVAEPVAFGFLGPTAAPISINGSNLTVDPKKTLSIVGGDTRLAGATLTAPGGRIQIDGVGSGEVPLQTLDAGSANRRGAIQITGSTLDASGDPGGTVVIRGGQLFVDSSSMMANTLGATDGARLGVDLQASGQLTITNGATVATAASAGGRGGDIRMTADRVDLTGGASVASSTLGLGRGGDIRLMATHLNLGGATLSSQTFGDGSGGDVWIDAGSVTLGLGSIFSQNSGFGAARGGNISIGARDSIDVSGTTILSQTDFSGAGGAVTISASSLTMDEGASIQSFTLGEGRGGDVSVEVGNSSLTGGASVSTATTSLGRAGNLIVTATGSALIADAGSGLLSASFSEGPGGDVTAHFGSLTLTRGALIQAGLFGGTGGGNLTVTATDSMVISNQAGISSQAFTQDVGPITVSSPRLLIDNGFISTSTLEVGRAGNISLNVASLTLTNGGQIASSSIFFAEGAGGDIKIAATESVTIAGTSPARESPIPEPFKPFIGDASSGIFSTASSESPNAGSAGSITVSTSNLTLTDGGKLSVATTGVGDAGQVVLDVAAITMGSGAGIGSSTSGAGRGGNVTIDATSVSISGRGTGLFSTTSSTGDAGQITVSAPTVVLDAGGQISVATSGTGSAGGISINGTAVSLTGGGRIDSGTTGAGRGGTITVGAAGSLSFGGRAGLLSTAAGTGPAGSIAVSSPIVTMTEGGTISVATVGAGDAGDIQLSVGTLTAAGGAQLNSSTTGAGQGGTITVQAGTVALSDSESGLFSTATSTGNAGQIALLAPTVNLADAARIDSGTTGAGQGGTITLDAASSLSLSGGAGLFSNAGGTGPGGDVNVTAGRVKLLGGSTFSARSTGGAEALAGNVSISFGDTFLMQGSSITTESLLGDGGNIAITSTGSMLRLTDSQITTSVRSGVGAGGNITLGSNLLDFLVLANSEVLADAFGGPGGNIRIFADVYLTSGSVVSASSALSTPGTIDVEARITDLSGSLVQLPESFLQAATLLRASCAARITEGTASSLVVAGREGVPPEPEGPLWSPLGATLADRSLSLGEEHERELFSRFTGVWLGSNCAR